MSLDPFHLNRPVHLARRDVFYKRAVELIGGLNDPADTIQRRERAEKALFMLREARRHAKAANRSEKTSDQSRLFVDFLDNAVDNTQSIARMLRRQTAVRSGDNPLDRFLCSEDTGAEMHKHYSRCAEHILKGLLNILEQAQAPFDSLRQNSLSKMSPVDKARYEKANAHFTDQADGEAVKAVEVLFREEKATGRNGDSAPPAK